MFRSYRNPSIDLQHKSFDWFLDDENADLKCVECIITNRLTTELVVPGYREKLFRKFLHYHIWINPLNASVALI